jgi:hypothetical protein
VTIATNPSVGVAVGAVLLALFGVGLGLGVGLKVGLGVGVGLTLASAIGVLAVAVTDRAVPAPVSAWVTGPRDEAVQPLTRTLMITAVTPSAPAACECAVLPIDDGTGSG